MREQQDELVRVDLSEKQFEEPSEGWLTGPDGRRYVRRSTRTKRAGADGLIADGVPLVLHYWAGGQLDWFSDQDARTSWQAVRRDVITGEPSGKGDIEWTAGRWEDEDGHVLLLLTGHC